MSKSSYQVNNTTNWYEARDIANAVAGCYLKCICLLPTI
jgi:hypothetical protein